MDEYLQLRKKFDIFRTGTLVFSAGENIGDLIILTGRHDTIQHSCILVWLNIDAIKQQKLKVEPRFIDDNTTKLSFLGLAEGGRIDVVTGQIQKGLILWEPEELLLNAPIVYTRNLNEEYISDSYVTHVMQKYIETHHLKLKYLYGLKYIATIGIGLDVFGPQKQGVLCSGNLYMFLKDLCGFPEFDIERINMYERMELKNVNLNNNKNVNNTSFADKTDIQNIDLKTQGDNPSIIQNDNQGTIQGDNIDLKIQSPRQIKWYPAYKLPDAEEHMFVPDFFYSEYNTHPVMEQVEYRVVSCKSEEDVTVQHPYIVALIVLILIVVFFFWLISNYCESCASGATVCTLNKDYFDML